MLVAGLGRCPVADLRISADEKLSACLTVDHAGSALHWPTSFGWFIWKIGVSVVSDVLDGGDEVLAGAAPGRAPRDGGASGPAARRCRITTSVIRRRSGDGSVHVDVLPVSETPCNWKTMVMSRRTSKVSAFRGSGPVRSAVVIPAPEPTVLLRCPEDQAC